MANDAVKFVLEKIAPFFEKEIQLLRGDQEEVANLRRELERMKASLTVADALGETHPEVKVWVEQVRDAAHDIEDILDEYMILLTHNHGEGLYGFIHKMSCCIRNMKARYRLASSIPDINSRIRPLSDTYHRLSQRYCVNDGSSYNPAGNMWQEYCRGAAMLLDKTDLVGIDKPKRKLVGWLVNGDSNRKVISLSGMGGLGKTTLAKQVYDDAEVKKHFEIHAWVTFSQSFKLEGVLKDLIQQLYRVISKPVPEGVDRMSIYQLMKIVLKILLQKRRYLVVLDDIWHISDWDDIKYALPNNDYGSRVMLTTRDAALAHFSCMETEGEEYDLQPLPAQESWTLFCRKTFHGNACPTYLEEICKRILRKCEGLPLAIVAISGVLTTKDWRRIDEWEMVHRSLGAEIDGNSKLMSLKKVLSLSFNDLPYYLKSCLLYFSIFPEDHPVKLARLIRLWTAEGFVEVKQGKTQEEVAEGFFNELLNRSLIQVVETTRDGRVKSCRTHDLLREIIILKSREQKFAAVAKERDAKWPDKVRRLSVHNTLQNVQANRSFSQLRSLFLFGVEECPSLHRSFPEGFRLLAVLDLQGIPLDKFPIQVANLYHLKYLSLRETRIKAVPRFIGKLHNLETLDLKHCHVTELPVEVLQLLNLRHLLIYRYDQLEPYDHFGSKYGFKALEKMGDLQSLQKLCFVEVDEGSVILAELGKLTQLRRLGVIKLRKEAGKKLCSSIENMASLRALSIVSIDEDEIIDVQHLISPPPLLQRLYLRGRLEMIPHWIPRLHSLVRIYLKWSCLKKDPLVSLENLPNLVHLELTQVYDGESLCFKAGGFQKLNCLGLDMFDELKWVQVELGAMPCLEKLRIQRCKSMLKVPLGIEYLTKLNVLELFDMPRELIRTLGDVPHEFITKPCLDNFGEDYWRIAHIPEVYCNYWIDGAWEVFSLESFIAGETSPRPNTVISSQDLHTRWK